MNPYIPPPTGVVIIPPAPGGVIVPPPPPPLRATPDLLTFAQRTFAQWDASLAITSAAMTAAQANLSSPEGTNGGIVPPMLQKAPAPARAPRYGALLVAGVIAYLLVTS